MPFERRLGRENPYYYWSTPMIRTRLFTVMDEMHVRPIHKSLRLFQLVTWVINELPEIAPDDPRTQEALDLAGVIWEQSRDTGT